LLIVSVALGGLVDHADIGGGHDFDVGGHDVDVGGPDVDSGYGDFHGPGISPLSLPIVLAFGTTFGGVGALLEQAGLNPYTVPLLAVVASVITAGIMYYIVVAMFVRTQATSTVSPRALVGRDAVVSVAIQPGKIGQVLIVTEERGRTLVPAIADEAIPTDAAVVIGQVIGSNVKVKRK
jgi:phage shock protein PspC (stress-responsive transcriptional regulator)